MLVCLMMSKVSRWMSGVHALLAFSSWNREQIEAFQIRRLRSLVRHAYECVPYYRRLFNQAKLKPEDIRSLADLSRIPVSTRAGLQEVPMEEIVARSYDPRKLVANPSSGSTGEPLIVWRTWFEQRLLQAFRLRAHMALGLRLRDHRADVILTRRQCPVQPGPFCPWSGLLKLTAVEPTDSFSHRTLNPGYYLDTSGR